MQKSTPLRLDYNAGQLAEFGCYSDETHERVENCATIVGSPMRIGS
jgi:hypothetical protein